jgi:CSLREA domain-containing protein
MKSRWSLFCSVAAGLCLAALSASAAVFTIPNGDVAALISAINTSSSNAQNDTINLASNGTYTFTAADQSATSDGPADGITALPEIGRDGVAPNPFHTLILNGNNATLIRATGAPAFRLLKVFNTGAGASVTINNLTFANGDVPGSADGGGILIAGTVTLNNCYVRDSVGGKGGGISNQNGSLILNNCTIANCTASKGGGLYNGNPANYNSPMTVTSCTFYNNHATDGGNIFNDGPRSGPYGFDQGETTMDLISCTLREGAVRNDGNGAGTKVTFKNSIFSNSPVSNYVNGNFGGTVTSLGFNLSTATAQGYFTAVTDRWNAVAKLDTAGLKMNGGPTPTFALCAGSEAIDHGNRYNITTDQRGSPRPVDNPLVANTVDGTDIGAFEAPADPIQCSPYTVTTFADHNDGVCSGSDCTFREAIAQTNSLTNSTDETRTITFAPSITGRMGLTGGQLSLTKPATIIGPGARLLEISGNAQGRVFSLSSSVSGAAFSGLTIRDGYVSGTTGASVEGGGIYNAGNLSLSDCALVHNNVVGGGGLANTSNPGGTARGGAIFNSGYLTVTRCTIGGADSNTSNGVFGGKGSDHPTDADLLYHGGTGGGALGGAIYNDTNGTVYLENTTIAGNTATGGNGGAAYFGGAGGAGVAGIYNLHTMFLTGATVSANSAVGGTAGHSEAGAPNAAGTANGGVYAEQSTTTTVSNTIIAGNTRNPAGAMDVSGSFTSNGFNLIGITNGQSGFTNPSDQAGTPASPLNPVLGPLQNNGGPTNTMALLNGSPALDKGSAVLATDQRSQPRPKDNPATPNATGGNGSDIGAFEADTNVVGPSPTPTPVPSATPSATPGHLLNIATRLRVQTGDNALIGGFIITGSDPKQLVIRGIGPSLAQFFSEPLPDPTLELYQGDTLLATNNDWKESQAEIEATGLQPSNDLESAIVRTLVPGNYTAIVRGNGNLTGIGVVEAYDLNPSSNSKLANIATRGFVDTGDNVMIGGFITGGDAQIVIRAIGPSLGNFGVSGALQDPTLDLVNSNGDVIRSNDNWRESQQSEIAATGLQPGDDRESALIESLPAGNYTAVVRGVGNSTGIGLVEIYDYH